MAPQDIQSVTSDHDGIELIDIDSNAVSSLLAPHVNDQSNSFPGLEDGQIFSSKGKEKNEGKVRGRSKTGNYRKGKVEGKASSNSSTAQEQQPTESASDIDYNTHQRPAHVADLKHLLTEDTRFEHRQYMQKQLRRLQREACRRHTCKAYVPSRCRVHSHLFRELDEFMALRAGHDFASGSFYRSVDNMFKPGESTETCATIDVPWSKEDEEAFNGYEQSICKMVEFIDKLLVTFMLFCLFVAGVPMLEALFFKR